MKEGKAAEKGRRRGRLQRRGEGGEGCGEGGESELRLRGRGEGG